jgi:hypothetical protein
MGSQTRSSKVWTLKSAVEDAGEGDIMSATMKKIFGTIFSIASVCVFSTFAHAETNTTYWSNFSTNDVEIQNHLSDCVEIAPSGIVLDGSIVLLKADGHFKQPTGSCGCRSGILSYKVDESRSPADETGSHQEWTSGAVAAMPPVGTAKQFTFVIGSDSELRYRGKLVLTVDCRPKP